MPSPTTSDVPAHIVERPDLQPLLPILYVAWSDGTLSTEELALVRDRMVGCPGVLESSAGALASWLDPSAPPTPGELSALRDHIRARATSSPERSATIARSLAELGLALSDGREPDAWSDPTAAETLRAIEEILGVQGAEAARELLGPMAGVAVEDRAEQPPPPFDPKAIGVYLDGERAPLRRELLELLTEDRFHVPLGTPTGAYRERVFVLLNELADRGYGRLGFPEWVGGGGDVAGSIAVFETLAFGDLSLLVKFGVQFGLFGGSILHLGTEKHHRAYLADVGSLALPGCYAMSETRHGSNVRDLETTATYDGDTAEFVVHTPHELAAKDWIGNAAVHGRMSTVFAQLQVGGRAHGVHALLVPIRDAEGSPLPGVEVRDSGRKEGLNGVDNGSLRFTQVRVPRDALLDRFGRVTEDGTYQSSIPSEGRRFFTMLGTLVSGRVSIAAAAVSAAKTGLAIAVRYSDRRRQFGPSGGPEVRILDYLTQQRLLLPRLATTYALHFGVRDLARRYATRDESTQRELEVRAAGLKAVASWHTVETLQACREACGGKGYLSENRFARLKADTDVFTTFEGANVVLLQLVAKGLLTRYRQEMGDLKLWGIAKYIAESAGRRVAELNPIVTRRDDDEHLLDPEFHATALEYREDRLLGTLARRLKARLDDGMDSFDAMNACQDHVVTLALAHVDRLLAEAFAHGLVAAPAGVREALSHVYSVFALHVLERERAWYLESGYMEPVKTKAIRSLLNRRLAEMRPSAVGLVDAFGIPDALLGPAAFAEEDSAGGAALGSGTEIPG